MTKPTSDLYTPFRVAIGAGMDMYTRPYVLDDKMLSDAVNVNMRRPFTIESRRGESEYHDYAHRAITDGVRNIHRYKKRDGTKKVAIYTDAGDVYVDDDAGQFEAAIDSGITSNDGFCRFVTWKDVLLWGTDGENIQAYNDGESTEVIQPTMDGGMFNTAITAQVSISQLDGGGVLLDDYQHVYRFTASIYHGDTFLGETHPLHLNMTSSPREGSAGEKAWDVRIREYAQLYIGTPATGGTADDNALEIKKLASYDTTKWPTGAKYINIYRNAKPESGSPPSSYIEFTERRSDFWFVGSFSVEDADAAGTGDVLFTDDGEIPIGQQIDYGPHVAIGDPKPRFLSSHKGRMWAAYVAIQDLSDLSYKTANPFAVYYSEPNAPLDIRSASIFEIDPDDGEGITGIFSAYDEELLVFKANRTYVIRGGDDEAVPGTPNVQIDPISRFGCIAPQTIMETDIGIVWMSALGPVYYDGRAVQPMAWKRVRPEILSVPDARRPFMCGTYDGREREISFFYSRSGESANQGGIQYNIDNDAWTRQTFVKGIGAAMFVDDTDQNGYVLLGRDDSVLTNFSVVLKKDDADTEPGASAATSNIATSFSTGFISCGTPHLDKQFYEIVFDYRSPVAVSVDVTVDGKTLYDSNGAGDTKTLPASTVDTSKTLRGWGAGIGNLQGRRIKIDVSLSNNGDPAEFQGTATLIFRQIGVRDH